MGQRLILNITFNGEMVANIYQHWSGYTDPTIDCIEGFIEHFNEFKENNKVYDSKEEFIKDLMLWFMKEKAVVLEDEEDYLSIPESIRAVIEEKGIRTNDVTEGDIKVGMVYISDYCSFDRNNGWVCFSKNGAQRNIEIGDYIVGVDTTSDIYHKIDFQALECGMSEDDEDIVGYDIKQLDFAYDYGELSEDQFWNVVDHIYNSDEYYFKDAKGTLLYKVSC